MLQSRQQKKVLFLTTADNIGGMERVVCSLSRQFTRRGWATRTIFPESGNKEALLSWCRAQGINAETHPAVLNAVAPHTRKDMAALTDLVRRIKPDVVNLHYGDNAISLKDVLAVRLAGKPKCIVTVNHPMPWGETEPSKRKLTRLAAALAENIVVISRATRQVLREAGIPEKKIALIPCGLPVPASLPTTSEARARLGLPSNALIVGTLAQLVLRKGIGNLIDAVAAAPNPNGDRVLAVAGTGAAREPLANRAAERLKDRCIFLGRVRDVDDFYAACDIFALPSHEGFGLVYVEAAFHGLPSIGADIGGCPDVVLHEKTGLLVPFDDVEALSQAIARLCGDQSLRENLGNAARARALSEFTEDVIAARYARIFSAEPLPAHRECSHSQV